MKRAIFIICTACLLIALAIYESLTVTNILVKLNTSISEIVPRYEENKDNITILYNDVTEITVYWDNVESPLCLMFNHKDLSTITDGFNRLLSFTKNNDYNNAIAEINFLKGYCENADHLMGFNIHNIL